MRTSIILTLLLMAGCANDRNPSMDNVALCDLHGRAYMSVDGIGHTRFIRRVSELDRVVCGCQQGGRSDDQ